MRIVVHGQQAFGKAVLEALLARGENVVGVFCAPDKEGGPRDPLAEYAETQGLPVHQPSSWKTREALELMASFDPDLCVMAYVTLFVPLPVLELPRYGTIQYHPSLLPRHRGPSSINWPIAQGETQTGLTIFWPDEGLDEGPILLQKEVDIGADETLGEVYFNKLFPLGVEAMLEAVDMVRAGTAPKQPQDHARATYESWFTRRLAEVDWAMPAADIYNLIRAANPQPGAWTAFGGTELSIYDCTRVDNAAGRTGEVLAVGSDGVLVAAGKGAILIRRLRPAGGAKMPASEFAAKNGLKVGDTLAS